MIYKAFVVMEKLGWLGLFSRAFLEKKERAEKLGRVKNGLVYTFSFLHASNAEKSHPSSPITTKAS